MNRRGANRTGPLGGAGMVGLWGASSLIQSVQYGTITLTGAPSNTATITAVDTTRSVVFFMGSESNDASATTARGWTSLVLTNATTITAARDNAGNDVSVGYLVIEFAPGAVRSVQTVSSTNVNGPTGTSAAISSVNLAKTIVMWGSLQATANSYLNYIECMKATITSATALLFSNGYTGGSPSLRVWVVEFY